MLYSPLGWACTGVASCLVGRWASRWLAATVDRRGATPTQTHTCDATSSSACGSPSSSPSRNSRSGLLARQADHNRLIPPIAPRSADSAPATSSERVPLPRIALVRGGVHKDRSAARFSGHDDCDLAFAIAICDCALFFAARCSITASAHPHMHTPGPGKFPSRSLARPLHAVEHAATPFHLIPVCIPMYFEKCTGYD